MGETKIRGMAGDGRDKPGRNASGQASIKLAARLYTNRDEVKAYLGPGYQMTMETWKTLLKAEARRLGKSNIIDAATVFGERLVEDQAELAARFVLAAAVEMLEPSE